MARAPAGEFPYSWNEKGGDDDNSIETGHSSRFSEEGMGASAAPGDATWLHTFYDSQFWTAEGGDFSASVSSSGAVSSIGFCTFDSTFDPDWSGTARHAQCVAGVSRCAANLLRLAAVSAHGLRRKYSVKHELVAASPLRRWAVRAWTAQAAAVGTYLPRAILNIQVGAIHLCGAAHL